MAGAPVPQAARNGIVIPAQSVRGIGDQLAQDYLRYGE
jgi:hypothetical protein